MRTLGEEREGKARITIEIEINEAVMDMAKQAIAQMPNLAAMRKRARELEEPQK